jgi:hypothetical protein
MSLSIYNLSLFFYQRPSSDPKKRCEVQSPLPLAASRNLPPPALQKELAQKQAVRQVYLGASLF